MKKLLIITFFLFLFSLSSFSKVIELVAFKRAKSMVDAKEGYFEQINLNILYNTSTNFISFFFEKRLDLVLNLESIEHPIKDGNTYSFKAFDKKGRYWGTVLITLFDNPQDEHSGTIVIQHANDRSPAFYYVKNAQ